MKQIEKTLNRIIANYALGITKIDKIMEDAE